MQNTHRAPLADHLLGPARGHLGRGADGRVCQADPALRLELESVHGVWLDGRRHRPRRGGRFA